MARPTLIRFKILLPAICLTLLNGCYEQHSSTESLCESYPQICAETNLNDGQCRLQRTKLIWQRYDVLKNPADIEKYKELKFTYEYQKCLDYAARIEPTNLKERKNNRAKALIASYRSIDRLNKELAHSTDPEIIYYRLTQGDKSALRQFLQLEGKPALETPELQLALATFYTDKDKEKTIQLLKHALELYEKGQGIKPEIIQSLATLSHQTKSIDSAYLWARVGSEFGIPVASQEKLVTYYPMPEEKRSLLNDKAEKISKAIQKGNFKARMAK
ncbi:DUF2989 domain-containing protein [uncultured Photobacterium sp.]|uniref:DUF2989 domain-containing protein n=1 Tax=uncultured Photobacterium sp. TaxID=173973 RepID=UPI002603A8EF|nr:DUF2989 domain-containing protein [uncultured Photobacterium sp.]